MYNNIKNIIDYINIINNSDSKTLYTIIRLYEFYVGEDIFDQNCNLEDDYDFFEWLYINNHITKEKFKTRRRFDNIRYIGYDEESDIVHFAESDENAIFKIRELYSKYLCENKHMIVNIISQLVRNDEDILNEKNRIKDIEEEYNIISKMSLKEIQLNIFNNELDCLKKQLEEELLEKSPKEWRIKDIKSMESFINKTIELWR